MTNRPTSGRFLFR